jgi:hypothetical protein
VNKKNKQSITHLLNEAWIARFSNEFDALVKIYSQIRVQTFDTPQIKIQQQFEIIRKKYCVDEALQVLTILAYIKRRREDLKKSKGILDYLNTLVINNGYKMNFYLAYELSIQSSLDGDHLLLALQLKNVQKMEIN